MSVVNLRPQPFRASDVVEVIAGPNAGEQWLIACYDANRDEAWIAGWPETLVTEASTRLRLETAATDDENANMLAACLDSSGPGPRQSTCHRLMLAGAKP